MRLLIEVWLTMPKNSKKAHSSDQKPFHPAYGAMQDLIRVTPDTDLTQPADLGWADRLDAEYGSEKSEK